MRLMPDKKSLERQMKPKTNKQTDRENWVHPPLTHSHALAAALLRGKGGPLWTLAQLRCALVPAAGKPGQELPGVLWHGP